MLVVIHYRRLRHNMIQQRSTSSQPELYAEAQQLTAHHHQLQKLTSLTEDLVRTLQSLQLPSAASPVSPTPVVMAAARSPPTSVNPRLAFPERFDGSSSQCRGFLLQCTVFVNQQPRPVLHGGGENLVCGFTPHRKSARVDNGGLER